MDANDSDRGWAQVRVSSVISRARSAVAALALAGGLAAPAAWGAQASIASDPGADMTYAPAGTPDVIQVDVTFDTAVSVSGQPVFDLRVGSRVRQMSFTGGSGTTTLRFEYTVQSGDLDEDGVSHTANALRGGTITHLDGTSADRTVPVLARADDHKVDGVAPRFASVQVTSTPESTGTYKAGESIVVAVRFDETVQSSTTTSLELDLDGTARSAARTGIADDTLTFSYTVVAGDLDADGIRIPVNRLDVTDSFGNAATRATAALRTSQRVDAVAPGVSRATITSRAGSDQTYRAGDRIDIQVVFDEPVRGADGSSFALLLGSTDAASQRRADYFAGDGTDRITYRYVVAAGDVDPDGISFAAGALSGSITDRAGNALPADAVPPLAEQPDHKVDGGVDNEPPRVSDVAVTSQPDRNVTYATGQRLEVTVRFDETVVVPDPTLLKLVVSIGNREVRADLDDTSSGSAALRFRYEIAAGDLDANGIAVGPIAETLVGGAIADPSGNAAVREFQRLPDQSLHRVDGVAPEVTRVEIVSQPAADTYGLGEEIEVQIDFSEAVVAYHDPDLKLTLAIGTESRQAYLADGERTSTLTFRYRVQQDDFDDDGVAIGATAFVTGRPGDLAGNRAAAAQPGLVLANQTAHKVDARATAAATVAIVSDAGADDTYARGEVIELDVTFQEQVVVNGAPELVLNLGASGIRPLLRRASLVRQRPQQLTFRYEVQDGDRDSDGISVGANALIGDIVDSHGNPARTLTPLADASEHKVDGVEPVPVGTEITSVPASDDTYGLGETITFAVSFSEVVHVTESGSDLVLRISVGEHSRNAVFAAGSGTRTLHFRYVVTDGDRDDDGISMGADAMVCSPNETGCSTQDSAGNVLTTVLQGMPARPRHRVDGRRDQGRLSITSTPARAATYGVGEHIVVTLAFPHPVFVLSRAEEPRLPELALSLGGAEAVAIFDGGSGTSILRFRYTVQPGDFDGDGISVAAGPGALVGGRIEDDTGDAVPRDFAALAADSSHRVDAVRASAVGIEIVSAPIGEDYGLGETIEAEVAFDEVVHVTENGSELQLVLAVGEHSRRATFVDGSGTDTLSFAYRITADDRDDDGISVGPDALVGGVIEDIAGNETEEAERRLPALPAQPGHRVNPDLDTVAPTVVRVAVASMPADASYGVGEAIAVEVEFDEIVHVSDAPTLELSIGPATRQAVFDSGSGTGTLSFSYVVQAGDSDGDGISVGPGANSLTGGTIQDAAGNEAVRAFEGLPADSRHTVNTRLTPPGIADVRIASSPKTYRQGDAIDVDIEFSEVVHVVGGPALTISIGARDRAALYVSGSGTDTLRFSYAIATGDFDGDGISIGANALAGGSIADATGAPVQLDFAAIPQQPDHRVDAVLAAVAEVSISSDPGPDDAYEVGESIEVAVVFDEDVLVIGQPVVALSVGAATRYAVFTGGAGTATLTFAYVVGSGDRDLDGVSVAANSLAGGTITDLAGNEAVRDFRGLPADPGHRVTGSDVEPPTVTALVIDAPDRGDTYLLGEVIEIRLRFSEEVHVTGEPSVALSVGARTRSAAFASGSGTHTLVFRYEVASGDIDEDGLSIASRALTGGGIADAAGNAAERDFDAVPADPGRKVDGLVPVVESVAIVSDPGGDGVYAPGDVIEVAVDFDAVVQVRGSPVLSLGIGANTRQAVYSDGSGTARLRLRYVVRDDDYDDDGISIPANALAGGAVEDASGNPVDRSYSALGAQAGHKVAADVEAPRVAAVDIEPPDSPGDTYRLGDVIEIRLRFTEEVHVTGEPSVALSVGAATRSAGYAAGSGTDTLVFRYEVQSGDSDDDGVSIAAGALTGGRIEDAAGNVADRAFDAVPADDGHRVDGSPPIVVDVTIESDPGTDETYSPGDSIEVAVIFDEAVFVSGSPVVTLGIGANSRHAAYADGSGTARTMFRYVVQEDDYDADGISIAANTLTGGTIEDASGNAVDRGFPARMFPGHKAGAEVAYTLETLALTIGRDETIDLRATLAQQGVEYARDFSAASDDETVVLARTTGGILTITPVSEGTATVTAVALRAPVAVIVPVVVDTSAAETAVLQHALATIGRSLLASASNTIGARLENNGGGSAALGRQVAHVPGGLVPINAPERPRWHGLQDVSGRTMAGHATVDHAWGVPGTFGGADIAGVRRPNSGMSFSIPMSSRTDSERSWGFWASVDAQSFEALPEEGAYDGSVTSFYVGADAVGAGWVAGAAASQSQADLSYEYDGDASGAGTLEADLTALYPYIQWSSGDRVVVWTVLGFGNGEADMRREGGPVPDEPGVLSMSMGLGGLRMTVGQVGGLELALRGDGGVVKLETEDGPGAIQGLAVDGQRVRAGVEASWPVSTGDGELTPFIDFGGRWDGGDGVAGGGGEIAGGIRYRGPLGGFEVKGRTLVQHGAEGYSESGVAATLFVAPRVDGRGLNLSLTPRRGIAESADRFWETAYGLRPLYADRRADRKWTLDGRIGYGFSLRARSGTVTPFGEAQAAGSHRGRARVGVSYELDSASGDRPFRFEVSLERNERLARRGGHRFVMSVEGRF